MNLLDIEKELAGADGKAALERYDGVLVALDQRIAQALQEASRLMSTLRRNNSRRLSFLQERYCGSHERTGKACDFLG